MVQLFYMGLLRSAGLDTCRFVFNCVTPETIIRLLMLGDGDSRTPLHDSCVEQQTP